MSFGPRLARRSTAAYSRGISSPQPLLSLYPAWVRQLSTTCFADHAAVLENAGGDPADHQRHGKDEHHSPGSGTAERPLHRRRLAESLPASASERQTSYKQNAPSTSGSVPDDSRKAPQQAQGSKIYGERRVIIHARLASRKVHLSNRQSAILEQKRSRDGTDVPDWRRTLRDLDMNTSDGSDEWHKHALRILLPSHPVAHLLFGIDTDIWSIKNKFSCQIQYAESKDDGTQSSLLLSGPIVNIARASAEICRLVPSAVVKPVTILERYPMFDTRSPSFEQRLGRLTRSRPRSFLERPINARDVPRPEIWTKHTFHAYVERLVHMRVPNLFRRRLYGSGKHSETVKDILMEIFSAEECRLAVSIAALNDALAFLVKFQYLKETRLLFTRMEHLRWPTNTETFNILLRGTARDKDLYTFQFILSLMLRQGHYPDTRTWIVFLKAVENPAIQAHVLDAMKRKKLLHDPDIQSGVCNEMVESDLRAALREDTFSIDSFSEKMSSQYGRSWRSAGAATRMVNVLAGHDLTASCWDVVQSFHDAGIILDIVCVNAFIARSQNLADAVGFFRRSYDLGRVIPDQNTYSLLWSLARRTRSYCTTRIIWQYACLGGFVSYRMRKEMLESLCLHVSAVDPSTETLTKFWRRTIGAFVFGTLPPGVHLGLDPNVPARRVESQVTAAANRDHAHATRPKKQPGAKLESYESNVVAHDLIDLHTGLCETHIADRPFAEVLLRALEADSSRKGVAALRTPGVFEELNRAAPDPLLRGQLQGSAETFTQALQSDIDFVLNLNKSS